jgi:hypothetical protein
VGKTVLATVGLVAAVAIAVVAPPLGGALVSALASIGVTMSAAIATAIVAGTLSIGLSLAFSALHVGAPSAAAQVGPPRVWRLP